ncbi:MAG: FKBP-type peptidyl-prolyl cis-trans isomerase [Prevotellaceae bacterium]|nr:FKBP-type peptidyl-prolyl cis-trans isomerase [Prevotellaceae bacterium]MDY2750474.1 FKBP-type peptidyl-prolyl cis-trans isomerase [Prevotella sp.]
MNKYYAIAYKLYTIKNGERSLEEEAPADAPFIFISGFGTTIPGFEKNIENYEKNQKFDFMLPKEEAFGERYEERVKELDKKMFFINGKFDDRHIFVDAIITLHNEDGNRFLGRVLAINEDTVRVDLNNPLAGYDLNFVGEVIECREATNEEIQSLINSLSGGCHGGCGGCKGGCGGDCDGECEDGGCKGGCKN